MKLSQLINYRNLLNELSVASIQHTANEELDKITYLSSHGPEELNAVDQQIVQSYQSIQCAFDNFEQNFDQLKFKLNELITETEKPWFVESYKLYDEEMQHETIEDIRFRTTKPDQVTDTFYHSRISRYQSWKHPALIIRPGYETHINHMLSCDPLYLVDVKYDFIRPAVDQYNEIYQNRLRPYVISERDDQPILEKIPNGQFGLVFAYNFFNFRPFEIIRRYLAEIHTKLRPGGMLIMTINDCDRDKGVDLVERHFCCYTPGGLVEELARTIGFETEFKWHNHGPTTWLEFRKTGAYESLRGGQTLAKIMPK